MPQNVQCFFCREIVIEVVTVRSDMAKKDDLVSRKRKLRKPRLSIRAIKIGMIDFAFREKVSNEAENFSLRSREEKA